MFLWPLSYWLAMVTLWRRKVGNYCTHFIIEKSETWRSRVYYSRLHSLLMRGLGEKTILVMSLSVNCSFYHKHLSSSESSAIIQLFWKGGQIWSLKAWSLVENLQWFIKEQFQPSGKTWTLVGRPRPAAELLADLKCRRQVILEILAPAGDQRTRFMYMPRAKDFWFPKLLLQ